MRAVVTIRTIKVRACQLRIDDHFIKQGTEYVVMKMLDGQYITYCVSGTTRYGLKGAMLVGLNSQEWVELITN